MKRLNLLVASLILVGVAGLANAQTPVVKKMPAVGNPMLNDVNGKMRQAMELIHKDLHSGKITKAQATSLKAQVMTVRKQELADFKTNGNHQLTDAQKSQINSSLDAIIASL